LFLELNYFFSMRKIFYIIAVFFLSACTNKEELITEGYKPIYVSYDNIHDVSSGSPVPIVNPGKIYLYNNLVFINEKGRGVHVINNTNPSAPQKTHFITIPGNYDIAIKNNFLYADNACDLVTIDINNLDNVSISSRISNVYDIRKQMYPDFANGYFECVDTTKGFVIGWYKTELINPKCRR